MKLEDILKRELDSIGDDHHSSNQENPIRKDAFDVSDAEKIKLIEVKVRDILEILGMDLTDDSLKGTPLRVAKLVNSYVPYAIAPSIRPATNACNILPPFAAGSATKKTIPAT